ncbi:probable methyltransferase-like protein 24 [Lates calcarifer]|uniref:Probable methyltransferase-like protein 24 n=1 Tax=Lates calcarifer TaxID=8187 RepID=A0AAJ7QD79_LATCA|nr:probable methyltransferase-like protein 24 [Lates calcarifer]
MRTCARCWGRWGSVPLRSGVLLLLIPPLLLALQLLVVGPRLPRAARAVGLGLGVEEEEEEEGAVAFSVISIEPERSSRRWGTPSRRRSRLQVGSTTLEVQPWAADKPSFTAELHRIITYITRPQLNCSKVLPPGQAQASHHWLLCAEDWLLPAPDRPCIAYSFSMDGRDVDFLETVSGLGCEVHSFDPSNSNRPTSDRHLGNRLASNHGNGGVVRQHKMWLEWRTPRKRKPKTRGNPGSVSQTLADIMAALGHRTVHFLYADPAQCRVAGFPELD